MATITHSYNVDQTVWLLDPDNGISKCVVLDISISSNLSRTLITYGLKIIKNNTQIIADQDSLYGTLTGIGSALEAYEALLVS